MRKLLAALLLISSAAFAQSPEYKIEKLADGVYGVIRQDPVGWMVVSNCVFIINDEDVILVDTGGANSLAQQMIGELRKLTSKSVKFLINTHWHDDHVIGNAAWRAAYPGIRFVGHASLREYLPGTGAKNRQGMIEGAPQFAALMQTQMDQGKNLRDQPISDEERASYASDIRLVKHYMEVVPGTPTVLPDIDVKDEMILTRGKRRIEVRHLGNGHTKADLVVWLPAERIAATGDLVVWPIPLVGSDQSHVIDWPATLDALLALKPAIFVPGHGPVLRDASYPTAMRNLFASIDRQVEAAVARGASLEETRKAVDLGELRKQFVGDSKVRDFAFGMYVAGPAVESAWNGARERKQ